MRGVQALLLAFERSVHDGFQLVGQLAQHVGLQAAQHERPCDGLQAPCRLLVAAYDGQLEALAEAVVRSQKARHEEVEDAPELA